MIKSLQPPNYTKYYLIFGNAKVDKWDIDLFIIFLLLLLWQNDFAHLGFPVEMNKHSPGQGFLFEELQSKTFLMSEHHLA